MGFAEEGFFEDLFMICRQLLGSFDSTTLAPAHGDAKVVSYESLGAAEGAPVASFLVKEFRSAMLDMTEHDAAYGQ
jgi:hypothetical protein